MIGIPLQTTVTQKQNDNDPEKQFLNQRFCIQPVRLMPLPETAGLAFTCFGIRF